MAATNNDAIFDYFSKKAGSSLAVKVRRQLDKNKWRPDLSNQPKIKLQLKKNKSLNVEQSYEDEIFSSDSCSTILEEKFLLEDYLTGPDVLKLKNEFFRHTLLSGSEKVTLDRFTEIVKNALKPKEFLLRDIADLFTRSDVYNQGHISWDSFISYIGDQFILSMSGIQQTRSKVAFDLPPRIMSFKQRVSAYSEIIILLQYAEDILFSVSATGVVIEWNINQNIVGLHFPDPKTLTGKKFRALCADLIRKTCKLIIGTASQELFIYNVKPAYNFICRIGKLHSVPVALHTYTKIEKDESMTVLISFGDEAGCVNCLNFKNFQDIFPNNCSTDIMTAQFISIEQLMKNKNIEYFRWKVHSSPVNEIRYVNKLNSIISCCSEKSRALVIGSIEGKKRIGKFHIDLSELSTDFKSGLRKSHCSNYTPSRTRSDEIVISVIRGVCTFDYSEINGYFATGGYDKILRIWNVNQDGCPELVKNLYGHRTRFTLIKFHETTRGVIITLSEDKEISIWDSFSFQPLHTLLPYDYIKNVKIPLKGAVFSGEINKLYILSDSVYTLVLHKSRHKKDIRRQKNHRSTINCVLYRSSTNALISGDQKGIIKMWDLTTGNLLGDYRDVTDEMSPVTSLMFDSNDVRLMSSHDDGLVRVWNIISRQCVKIYKKNNTATVTRMAYMNFNQFRWLVTTGWDRQLHFYSSLQINGKLYQDPIFSLTDKAFYPNEGVLIMKGHIQCMLELSQSKLVIGSDDGEIHIWDVLFRKMIKCLVIPPPVNFHPELICHASVDLQIREMMVLSTREKQAAFEGAVFITLGPYNMVHFWTRLILDGRVLASFFPTIQRKTFSSCMDVTKHDHLLFTGDGNGNVSSWNLHNYASTSTREINPPPLKVVWKAHKLPVTDIKIIRSQVQVLITSSADLTIKLWTLRGNLLGVFGKTEWNLNEITAELPRLSTVMAETGDVVSISKPSTSEVIPSSSGETSEKMMSRQISKSSSADRDSLEKIVTFRESDLMKLRQTMSPPSSRSVAYPKEKSYVKDKIQTGVYHAIKLNPENGELLPLTIKKPRSFLNAPKRHRKRSSVKQKVNFSIR